jgi:S1-C subfamily serine protease
MVKLLKLPFKSIWAKAFMCCASILFVAIPYPCVAQAPTLADVKKRYAEATLSIGVTYETLEGNTPVTGCKRGSGFIISATGYVVTSFHLLTDENEKQFMKIVKIQGRIGEPLDCTDN